MTDTFRKQYIELHPAVKDHINAVKDKAQELLDLFNGADAVCLSDQRKRALAVTNLEQSIMWYVKALT